MLGTLLRKSLASLPVITFRDLTFHFGKGFFLSNFYYVVEYCHRALETITFRFLDSLKRDIPLKKYVTTTFADISVNCPHHHVNGLALRFQHASNVTSFSRVFICSQLVNKPFFQRQKHWNEYPESSSILNIPRMTSSKLATCHPSSWLIVFMASALFPLLYILLLYCFRKNIRQTTCRTSSTLF